jgi:tRNA 5-methylaminomethyl-2-thiouridine biosynthesis bifunctional protein
MSDALASLCFPQDWVRAVDQDEAGVLADMPVSRGGLFFADGMLVRPGVLIETLLTLPGIERRCAKAARLRRHGVNWQVLDAQDRELAQAPTVIVANAGGALNLLSRSQVLESLPRLAQMQVMAGEITLLPTGALNGGPRCIVGGEGYLLPAQGPWCVAGSTYVDDASHAWIGAQGQGINLQKMAGLLCYMPGGVASLPPGTLPGWAGWRAVLPGSLPMVGELAHAPGLWLAVGYASRGLSWSALIGDVIAARLCGEPMPLESKLVGMIAPR